MFVGVLLFACWKFAAAKINNMPDPWTEGCTPTISECLRPSCESSAVTGWGENNAKMHILFFHVTLVGLETPFSIQRPALHTQRSPSSAKDCKLMAFRVPLADGCQSAVEHTRRKGCQLQLFFLLLW